MNNLVSTVDGSGLATDIAELVAIVAIALCLEQAPDLRTELRQCAGSAADRPLRVRLPIGQAGIEIPPGGELRPLRPADSAGAENPRADDTGLGSSKRLVERLYPLTHATAVKVASVDSGSLYRLTFALPDFFSMSLH